MAHWLLKTEPTVYSYSDLERDRQTMWEGVKNNAALKHIGAMEKGDECVIYHTGKERAAVGIATVVRAPYKNPYEEEDKYVVVDVRKKRRLLRPVGLTALQSYKAFKGSPLSRQGRLSVVPLTALQWRTILILAETEA